MTRTVLTWTLDREDDNEDSVEEEDDEDSVDVDTGQGR